MSNTDITCFAFGKGSPVAHSSQLLRELVCRNRYRVAYERIFNTPVPILKKRNIRIGSTDIHYDILQCSEKSVCHDVNETISKNTLTRITLFPRPWLRPYAPRIHHVMHRMVVNPVLFMLKYRAVKCDSEILQRKGKTFKSHCPLNM